VRVCVCVCVTLCVCVCVCVCVRAVGVVAESVLEKMMVSWVDHIAYVRWGLSLYVWLFSSRENENIVLKDIVRKLHILLYGLGFMIYSKDTKGLGPKYNPDPDLIKNNPKLEVKTIIFIRHGESDWNDVFKLVVVMN
jgi:hypothetical protein